MDPVASRMMAMFQGCAWPNIDAVAATEMLSDLGPKMIGMK